MCSVWKDCILEIGEVRAVILPLSRLGATYSRLMVSSGTISSEKKWDVLYFHQYQRQPDAVSR